MKTASDEKLREDRLNIWFAFCLGGLLSPVMPKGPIWRPVSRYNLF